MIIEAERTAARRLPRSSMDKHKPPTSHGVFKPVGHVVISFPSQQDLLGAEQALMGLGLADTALTRYTPQEMVSQADADIERADALASVGQELNLVKAQKVLAKHGYHFLVVETPNDDLARQVAASAQAHNAERAQLYGRFIIEELIAHADDEHQVAESPDRGLDAQTPSGLESERVQRHRDT